MADPAFADQEFFADQGDVAGGDAGCVHTVEMFPVNFQQTVINGISRRFVAEDHAVVVFFVVHAVNNLYRPPISPTAIRL